MMKKDKVAVSNRISVIIPIHNAEKFIQQTLVSLMKVKIPGLQVVCVLDNCSDNSKATVQSFFEEIGFSNFLLFETAYGQTANARNEGMALAEGEFVAFMDHDDIVDAEMYNRLLTLYDETQGCDVLRCGFSIYHGTNLLELVEVLPPYKAYPFRGIFVWNGIFKKSFLIKHKICFLPGYGEDYEFNLAFLSAGAREGRIEHNSVYYQWHQHDGNLHKKRRPLDFIRRIESMLTHHGAILAYDQEIADYMRDWVIDYLVHLVKTCSQQETSKAYIASKQVQGFLSGSYLPTLEYLPVRKLVAARSIEEFNRATEMLMANEPVTAQTTLQKYYKFCSDTWLIYQTISLKKIFDTLKHELYKNVDTLILGMPLANETPFQRRYRKIKLIIKSNSIGQIIDIVKKVRLILKTSLTHQNDKENMVSVRLKMIDELDTPKALFFVFCQEFISGGLISIFSIAEQFRNNGIEPVLVGNPGPETTVINKLFRNKEIIIPFNTFLEHGRHDFNFIMIPEVRVLEFQSLCAKHNLTFPNATLNIMNQNNDYMPGKATIELLRPYCKNMSVTTAHKKYTTQENADKWQLPVKHISTYLSFRSFIQQSFREKADLLLYSHDDHMMKARIMDAVSKALPRFDSQIILGLSYLEYQILIRRAKFTVSFGESLDNYFIEPFFTGGIGFAVYNATFMPSSFLKFDNVFSSYSEMERSLPALMELLIRDHSYRSKIWKLNFDVLSALYDDRVYSNKVTQYLDGERDFWPQKSK